MANILSQNNLQTIADVINNRFDTGVTALNAQAEEIARRIDNCYTRNETNKIISQAQKIFISPSVPTSTSEVGMYYVGTAQPYQSYLVDSAGNVTEMGVADIDLSDYQKKESDDLTTASKEVVGAINELKSKITASDFPVGMIVPFAGPTAPDGWLLCDGSEYPWFQNGAATKYYDLYEVIHGKYGLNGEFFSVPDFRGKFLEGASATSGHQLYDNVNAGLPNHTHTFTGTRTTTESTTPSMTFTGTKNTSSIDLGNSTGGLDGGDGLPPVATGGFSGSKGVSGTYTGLQEHWHTLSVLNYSYTPAGTISGGSHQHYYTPSGTIGKASANNSIYGASTTVQPASACINYIIKY